MDGRSVDDLLRSDAARQRTDAPAQQSRHAVVERGPDDLGPVDVRIGTEIRPRRRVPVVPEQAKQRVGSSHGQWRFRTPRIIARATPGPKRNEPALLSMRNSKPQRAALE